MHHDSSALSILAEGVAGITFGLSSEVNGYDLIQYIKINKMY